MNTPELNVVFLFGLQKKDIDIIERFLAEGKNWQEISNVIGWHDITAREYYERYVQRNNENKQLQEILPLLSAMVEVLKKAIDSPCFKNELCDMYSLILQSEKHLLSTPRRKNEPN